MLSAVRSLIALTVLILGLGFLGWAFLKHDSSLHETKPPHEHPFLRKTASDEVAYPGAPKSGQKAHSPAQLGELTLLPKDTAIWIDVRQRLDGTLVWAITAEEAETAPLADQTLRQIFESEPERRVILNFRGNRQGSREALAQLVDGMLDIKAGDRILVQSPEDGFLKDLRELKPLWLYGTSQAQVTRMILLSSLGLVALTPLKGDVLVIESQGRDHLLGRLTDDVIAETHRRKMKIYAGPVSRAEAQRLLDRGVDGVLISTE